MTCAAHATSIMHMSKMIQLRNVPDSLHWLLKARAALAGMPLSDFLIREVRKIAEYPTPEEMRERLSRRESYCGGTSPTDILRAERDSPRCSCRHITRSPSVSCEDGSVLLDGDHVI